MTGNAQELRDRREYVIGEVEFLAGLRDAEDLAQALGYREAEYLRKSLRGWDRMDLAQRLEDKEKN